VKVQPITFLLIFFLFQAKTGIPQKADTLRSDWSISFCGNCNKTQEKRQQVCAYIAPVILVTYGIMAIGPNPHIYDRFQAKADVQKAFPGFYSPADNYLQFAPAAAVFGLSAGGVKGKHTLGEQLILYAGSMLVSEGIATGLKYSTHILRPDNSAYNSFPSGHTTSAFTGAELLNQEYGSSSVLYPILGYGAASATGMMRLMNNRHWLSDVLVGAGIGMISTKLVYTVYPKLKKRLCKNQKETGTSMM